MMTAIVVGGAFFGDNLSFISDTTIAATRTQGCAMRDKFRANIKVALPAALLALACYILLGWNVQSPSTADISIEWMKVFPYLLVLVTALAGIHVMTVLTMGLLATGLIGIGMGYFSFMAWFQAMGSGMTGMGELIIVTLLAGGVLSIIRFNGGIAYIIGKITAHIHSRRGAEFSIAGLVFPGQPLHGQQYDRHHHGWPHRQGNKRQIPYPTQTQRQHSGHLFLPGSGSHPLRRSNAHGRRNLPGFSPADHEIPVLSPDSGHLLHPCHCAGTGGTERRRKR